MDDDELRPCDQVLYLIAELVAAFDRGVVMSQAQVEFTQRRLTQLLVLTAGSSREKAN